MISGFSFHRQLPGHHTGWAISMQAGLLCMLLTGCASGMLHYNKTSTDSAKRVLWREDAVKGDPKAQYELGNAYCCGENSFWSTKEAAKWWCKAAAKGYAPAKAALTREQAPCPPEHRL